MSDSILYFKSFHKLSPADQPRTFSRALQVRNGLMARGRGRRFFEILFTAKEHCTLRIVILFKNVIKKMYIYYLYMYEHENDKISYNPLRIAFNLRITV